VSQHRACREEGAGGSTLAVSQRLVHSNPRGADASNTETGGGVSQSLSARYGRRSRYVRGGACCRGGRRCVFTVFSQRRNVFNINIPSGSGGPGAERSSARGAASASRSPRPTRRPRAPAAPARRDPAIGGTRSCPLPGGTSTCSIDVPALGVHGDRLVAAWPRRSWPLPRRDPITSRPRKP
jgi:hypothetical protein